MNEEYDVIICGTGLSECLISGLLSQEGKRVLQIDRNSYYGDEGASLNLTSLWKLFRPGIEPPKDLGSNKDWSIDLIPKFVLANGNLMKILSKTKVDKYVEWKPVDGTFVSQTKETDLMVQPSYKIKKMPATFGEAIKSPFMGLVEKHRCHKFWGYIQEYDPKEPKTHGGLDLYKEPFVALVKKFNLLANTIDLIGHALGLCNDDFIMRPAIETIEKIKLYIGSHGRYGDTPLIYPVYGLGGISEGFSKMRGVYGGILMLNKDIDEVIFEAGKVCGVKSGDGIARCKALICNPSYMLKTGKASKVKPVGKIIRCICIMDHPIPEIAKYPSLQLIIPQNQVQRNSDIFVLMVSDTHQVCKEGFYVAIISANVETDKPEAELKPAFDVIGTVREKFITISDVYEPNSNFSDNVYITRSMDATSHFESTAEDVIKLYKKITGKDLDLVNLVSNLSGDAC